MSTALGAAVIAKTRAMYGKRLKSEDWEALINCPSIQDVMSYLKANTAYAQVLSNTGFENTHRLELEILLANRVVQDTAQLGHYDHSSLWSVSRYLTAAMEISSILHAVIRVLSHTDIGYGFENAYLRGTSELSLRLLDGAESFDEIQEAAAHTPYAAVLQQYMQHEISDYSELETRLSILAYREVYDYIEHSAGASERKAIKSFFDDLLTLDNYARIMRVKEYFDMPPEELKRLMLPFGGIRQRNLHEMIQANTKEEADSIMRRSSKGRKLLSTPHETVDDLVRIIKYRRCRKNILYGTQSGLVLASYYFLLQMEITRLVHLIEGIRYHLPKQELKNIINI